MWKRTLGVVLFVMAAGCGDESMPRRPVTGPTVIPPSEPPANRTIHGLVTDGNFAVANATLEIVSGMGAGTIRTSGPDGQYSLPPVPNTAGEIVIRARRGGFKDQEQRVEVTPSLQLAVLHFTLEPVSFANLAGEWRLTIEAAPSCETLPEAARTRRYSAAIAQSGAVATIHLLSGDFFWTLELGATVYASSARVRAQCGWTPCILERLPSGEMVGIGGLAEIPVGSNRLSGLMDGTFEVYAAGQPTASCSSAEHRLTLER